jgi:hypothetical protein
MRLETNDPRGMAAMLRPDLLAFQSIDFMILIDFVYR